MKIKLVYPKKDEVVRLSNENIEKLYNCNIFDISEISDCYFYNAEMEGFSDPKILNNKYRLRKLFYKYDSFYQVNNYLKWKSLNGAKSYQVTLALDKNFSSIIFRKTVRKNVLDLGNTLFINQRYFWKVKAKVNGIEIFSDVYSFSATGRFRAIKIQGVSNTRDCGGKVVKNGVIKQGLLYRGAYLDNITKKGLTAFNELGIKTDVDLRGTGEKGNPTNRKNCYVFTAPYYTGDEMGIVSEKHFETIKNIFLLLKDKKNYPIYVHCTIGRDRTGTFFFLLYLLLGLSKEDIYREYFSSMYAVMGGFPRNNPSLLNNLNDLFKYIESFKGKNLTEKVKSYLLGVGLTEKDFIEIKNILIEKNID